jgi:hypothetical protein
MGAEACIPYQSYLQLPSLENGNESNNLSKSVKGEVATNSKHILACQKNICTAL